MGEKDIAAVQWLRDRTEIEKLAFLYAKGNDIDAKYYEQCMCDDVEVVYPFGTWTGLEEHKRTRDATIGVAFTFTQHVISNAIIDVNGDTGRGEYYVYAIHGLRTPKGVKIICSGVIYTQDVIRTAKGWRIKRHHCEHIWAEDSGEIEQAVQTTFDDSRAV